MKDETTIELRPAAEWRRIVAYFDGAFLLAIGVGIWLNIAGLANGWIPFLIGIATFSPPLIVFNVLGLFSRIRIEQNGIHRRRWMVWDFWPWELFASSTLRQDGFKFIDPARRLGFRSLNLEFLPNTERAQLLERVESLIPVPVPDRLERTELRNSPLRKIVLEADGVHLTSRGTEPSLCPWDDVEQVEVRRGTHSRSNFYKLRLFLRGLPKPVEIRNLPGRIRHESVLALLSRHVPEARWLFISPSGHRTLVEVDRLIEESKERSLQTKKEIWIIPILGSGIVATLLVQLIQNYESALDLLAMSGLVLMVALPVFAAWPLLLRQERKTLRDLEQSRRDLLAFGIRS